MRPEKPGEILVFRQGPTAISSWRALTLWSRRGVLSDPGLFRNLCLTTSRTRPWFFVFCLSSLSRCQCSEKLSVSGRCLSRRFCPCPFPGLRPRSQAVHSLTMGSRSVWFDAGRQMSSAWAIPVRLVSSIFHPMFLFLHPVCTLLQDVIRKSHEYCW